MSSVEWSCDGMSVVVVRGAAGGASITIDFTKPVPVLVLAEAADIDPACIHGRTRRKDFGLVDVASPALCGRTRWVTGESGKAYFLAAVARKQALHSSK